MTFPNRIADTDKLQQDIKQCRPLKGQAFKELREYLRIRLTWASNAMEGNSLTESEARVVIVEGIAIGGKPLKDHLQTIGHAEAFDYLQKLAGRREIAVRNILKLHKLLYCRVDQANAGRYRKHDVTGTGSDYVFPAPSELPGLMAAFVEEIPCLRAGKHPIEFAALLHNRLVSIHPFVDGNGRAARLLMNLALLQEGYPVTIIQPVLRSEYLAAIREGDFGNFAPFVNLLSCMVWESQRDYLRLLQSLERE